MNLKLMSQKEGITPINIANKSLQRELNAARVELNENPAQPSVRGDLRIKPRKSRLKSTLCLQNMLSKRGDGSGLTNGYFTDTLKR